MILQVRNVCKIENIAGVLEYSQVVPKPQQNNRRGVGMVDKQRLKRCGRKLMRVRLPPPALLDSSTSSL